MARNRGLPAGLYRLPSGAYYTRHPLTREAVYYGTKILDEAKALHGPVWDRWARERLQKKAADIVLSIRIAENTGAGQLFPDLCRDFRESVLPNLTKRRSGVALSPKTRADYTRMLRNQIEPAEALKLPLAVFSTTAGIMKLREFLGPWLAKPNHYNYMLAILSRVFAHAIDTGKLASNPMANIERRIPAKRQVYLNDDAYLRITGLLEPWERRACDLLYLISHNPVDVLGLKESSVATGTRLDGKKPRETIEITFSRSKTDVGLEIWDWADSDLAQLLNEMATAKRDAGIVSGYLVVYPVGKRRTGHPITVGYLSHKFSAAVTAAGFEKGTFTLRDLRPKALTDEWLNGNLDNKGGHLTESMRQHYQRVKLPERAKNSLILLRKEK